jgi:hypothetical protein
LPFQRNAGAEALRLNHERYEANVVATTGDPSYAWDFETAARDGLGYQKQG